MAAGKVKDRKAAYNWFSESNCNSTDWTKSWRNRVESHCQQSDHSSVKSYSAVSNDESSCNSIDWRSKDRVESHCKQSDRRSVKSYSAVSNGDIIETDVGRFMNSLFLKQLYTDVKFRSKTGLDSISAHRVVLAAKCEKFAELLFGNKKNEAKCLEMTLTISNIAFPAFKKIIEYLYTDDIEFTDVSNVLDIYIGAKKFEVECLIERCESYIEFLQLTENNVCSIFQMCNDEILDELKNKCITYIQENTDKVISSPDFQKCSYNVVYTICNLPSLRLNSESQLLDAVMRWITPHPHHFKQELIQPFLLCIRFLTFSAAELGSCVQKYSDIMKADDALKLICFLNDSPKTRNKHNLPAWCNTDEQRRCTLQKHEAEGQHKIRKNVNGKISVSLKTSAVSDEILKFSSLLTMLCTKGSHQINSMKISFQDISLHENIIIYISVEVVHLKKLLYSRKLNFILSRKEKMIYFKAPIKVFQGCVVRFETEAVSRICLNLFKLDNNQHLLQDEHFNCNIKSKPEDKKLYFISEVQYGPRRKTRRKHRRINQ